MKVKKAIIPAAGFGTRLLPATKSIPKEMIPIVDKPSIQYIVEEAINSGIEEILIINGRNKESLVNHFDKSFELETVLKEKGKDKLLKITENISNMANIHFIRQKEAKGLGHAVLCAKTFVGNEPFAVLLGDDIVENDYPALKQLIDAYDEKNSTIIGVQTVPKDQVDKYGIIGGEMIADRLYKVSEMIEKPDIDKAPSNVAVLGRYVLDHEIFEILENTKPGKGGEIQLTDAIKELMYTKEVYAYDFKGKRYDTGDKLGYLKAVVEIALKHPELKDGFKKYIKDLSSVL